MKRRSTCIIMVCLRMLVRCRQPFCLTYRVILYSGILVRCRRPLMIPFRPVRVPNFPVVLFWTDVGALSELRGLPMVDWSTCPARIALFQDRLYGGHCHQPTIPFGPVRVPVFPAVMCSTDAGSLQERRGFSTVDWSTCPFHTCPLSSRGVGRLDC